MSLPIRRTADSHFTSNKHQDAIKFELVACKFPYRHKLFIFEGGKSRVQGRPAGAGGAAA